MAVVTIEGIFMGAEPKTSTWDGKEKTSINIDVYQPDSPDTQKSLQVKCDDLSLLSTLTKDYMMGVPIAIKASVNAYKNAAYYKLVKLLQPVNS